MQRPPPQRPEIDPADGAGPGRLARLGWRALALVCVGLGSVGAFLPLMPTTPFLLVAVYAASRSSPRLHAWLFAHPRFGPLLRDWRAHRALSRRSKRNAVILIAISWGITMATVTSIWLRVMVTLILAGVTAFLLTRPTAAARTGA